MQWSGGHGLRTWSLASHLFFPALLSSKQQILEGFLGPLEFSHLVCSHCLADCLVSRHLFPWSSPPLSWCKQETSPPGLSSVFSRSPGSSPDQRPISENSKAVCPAFVTDFIRTDPRLRIVGQNRGLTRLKELGARLGRTTLTSFSLSSLPGPVGKARLYPYTQSMTQQLLQR